MQREILARLGGPKRIWQLGGGLVLLAAIVVAVPVIASPNNAAGPSLEEVLKDVRTLDGQGNNPSAPTNGAAGTPYLRVADPAYPDGVGAMMEGPAERVISNRIFNDGGQNLFSENDASQWVWIWGQFIDHDIDLRDATKGENAPLPFDGNDPLERFQNDFGIVDFARTPAAPGTGTDSPREQINQISSFIDASGVYGVDPIRQDWLRVGPVDGDPTNNSAELLMPEDFLPRVGDRDDQISAPLMELDGPMKEHPELARIAGDQRANENMALTLIQTLMAREHNRIVGRLPDALSEEQKFQIARRVVGAEIQYITYNEFLPSVGVGLPEYQGYDQNVNPAVSNEFATVGYRAHSMVHGVVNAPFAAGDFTQAQLDGFQRGGVGISQGANGANFLDIPLNAMFGNPDLLGQVGIGRLAVEFAAGHQYRNDEQIDESMRSVLFQVPKPEAADPAQCGQPVIVPDCYSVVIDLGAIDVARGRDHGIPTYNALRQAYGLAPLTSFTEMTGESPSEPANGADPSILDFVQLSDINGNVLDPNNEAAVLEQAVSGVRRTTLASRLEAVYGSVDAVDAFVGMQAEPHPQGAELGALQRAIWRDQFSRLRDGDRYFYAVDPALPVIADQFGIDYKVTLSQLIELNTGGQPQPNVFRIPQTQ